MTYIPTMAIHTHYGYTRHSHPPLTFSTLLPGEADDGYTHYGYTRHCHPPLTFSTLLPGEAAVIVNYSIAVVGIAIVGALVIATHH